MTGNKEIFQGDEIDLVELAKVIWSRRAFILKVTLVFILLGLIVAFTSKVEYAASCKLLPEGHQSMNGNLGGLSGLAGLAGFNVTGLNTNGILSPEIYPEIVNSIPFIDKLINTPIYFEKEDTTLSSFVYFKEVDDLTLFGYISGYTIGLPNKFKKLFIDSEETELENYDLIRYSKEDWELIEMYRERLSISVDSDAGTIKITAEMPDPIAAAKVTEVLVQELTRRVINYKIEKSQKELDFINERFQEATREYESIQQRVARFADSNRNITNSIFQTEYERLQNELNVSFEVYKGLAVQLEQAKIKVKENTPIFTVLEPVKVPVDKSSPRRLLILVLTGLVGGIFGVILVIFKNQQSL